jgi:endonuclease/exonuclease/phosphatase (EEP) superfamily protein YafD
MSDNINNTPGNEPWNDLRIKGDDEISIIIGGINWNIGGLASPSSSDKIKTLRDISKQMKPRIILLQETHLTSRTEDVLRSQIPNYVWTFNHGTSASRGVAIGIRGNQTKINRNVIRNPEGTFLGVSFDHNDIEIEIYTVYFQPNSKGQPNNKKRDLNYYKNLVRNSRKPKIIGGDFNTDPSDGLFSEIEDANRRKKVKFIPNPFPSMADGKRIIDHVAMSESILTIKKPYIYAYPSSRRDHNPLIFSTKNELRSKGHDPIPPHIAAHPAFIERCKGKIPYNNFSQTQPEPIEERIVFDAAEFIKILEEAGRTTFTEWKANKQSMNFEKETFNRLWAARRLQKMMRNRNKIPTRDFKCPLHKELYEKHRAKPEYATVSEITFRKKTKREYTKDIKNEVYEASKEVGFPINLPKTLITDVEDIYLEKKFMSNTLSVVDPTNNLPCKDPNRTAKTLGDYWENIFGNIRTADRESTKKLMGNYPRREEEPEQEFDNDLLNEIINKTNATGSGPNGIPFSYYKEMHVHYPGFWKNLIDEVVKGTFRPSPNFTECRLVLLPKDDGTVTADRTRPIAITNAVYRILMKYFSKKLRDFLSKIISPNQRALLSDRYIDDCLDDVINGVQQMRWEGRASFILQTDYKKAYDFINRSEIKFMLEAIGAPPSLKNIANIALEASPTTIHINGAKPVQFTAITGVKQGCPLSPLLYIMIFDLLVSNLPNLKDYFARAYMDDIAIVMESLKQLDDLTEIFELYNKAVGSELNYKKTKIIYQTKELATPPEPWNIVEKAQEGDYLGITIANDQTDRLNWAKRIKKMGKAAESVRNGVNKTKATIRKRLTYINTYIISHIPYIGRFTIIPKISMGGIVKQIRKGLGGKNTIPNSALFSPAPPLNLKPAVTHPMLFNIACLACKRPPTEKIDRTRDLAEETVEWKRRWAINVYYRIIGLETSYNEGAEEHFKDREKYNSWKDRIKKPTHWIYNQMIARYPAHNYIDFTYDKGKHAYHFLLHNATHRIPSSLKNNLILYLHGAWNHNSRTAHFIHEVQKFCRMGCGSVETHEHFLDCDIMNEVISHLKLIFVTIQQRSKRLEGYSFPSKANILLVGKMLKREQTIFNLSVLLVIRVVITSLGYDKKLDPKIIAEYKWREVLNKLPRIEKKTIPPREQSAAAIDDPRPVYTETADCYGFFDGSGDIGNLKAGTGSIIIKDGIEIGAKARTSVLLTSNGGESYGPYDAKKMAIREGEKNLHLLGDSKLVINLENGEATSNNITLIQIHLRSRQLDKEFEKLTWQLIRRILNGRSDRVADAAMISKERGEYYEKNKEDMSRPKGAKTRPSIRDIEKTITFKHHNIILPKPNVAYPITQNLRPTKIVSNGKKKKDYELKKITTDVEKKWLRKSMLYEGHFRYEARKEKQKKKQEEELASTVEMEGGGNLDEREAQETQKPTEKETQEKEAPPSECESENSQTQLNESQCQNGEEEEEDKETQKSMEKETQEEEVPNIKRKRIRRRLSRRKKRKTQSADPITSEEEGIDPLTEEENIRKEPTSSEEEGSDLPPAEGESLDSNEVEKEESEEESKENEPRIGDKGEEDDSGRKGGGGEERQGTRRSTRSTRNNIKRNEEYQWTGQNKTGGKTRKREVNDENRRDPKKIRKNNHKT